MLFPENKNHFLQRLHDSLGKATAFDQGGSTLVPPVEFLPCLHGFLDPFPVDTLTDLAERKELDKLGKITTSTLVNCITSHEQKVYILFISYPECLAQGL